MQLNKPKKSHTKHSSGNLFDDDFASGFEDSKLDKFKPAIKALVVLVLLLGAVWGAVAYFSSTDTENNTGKDYTANTIWQTDDRDSELSQCIAEATTKNPTPETSDANFYPKLISGYDAQLACYDKYPDANGVISRSSLEHSRQGALDASGDHKDTYTASGVDSSSTSSKNSVTGCDYSLSESEYLACSDQYYVAHGGSSDGTPTNSTNTPSSTPSSSTPAVTPKPSDSTGSDSSGAGQNDAYAALNACLAEASSLPTEASRVRARQGCYQNHTPKP